VAAQEAEGGCRWVADGHLCIDRQLLSLFSYCVWWWWGGGMRALTSTRGDYLVL
jgi:hypothetical protein